MDKREKLKERYEDALFAIMMDELASTLGEEALEESERLNNDPTAAVPERLDKRCMQTIRRHFRKVAAKKAGRMTLRAAARVTMVFGLASVLFIGAFAASETVRINTMNLIVETFGDHSDFYFAPKANNSIPQISAGWVPEGLVLVDEGSDETSSWFFYSGEATQYIQVIYYDKDGHVMQIDTENADVSHIRVNDDEALLMIKDDSIQIACGTANQDGFIYIIADGVAAEDLIQVAENLQYIR